MSRPQQITIPPAQGSQRLQDDWWWQLPKAAVSLTQRLLQPPNHTTRGAVSAASEGLQAQPSRGQCLARRQLSCELCLIYWSKAAWRHVKYRGVLSRSVVETAKFLPLLAYPAGSKALAFWKYMSASCRCYSKWRSEAEAYLPAHLNPRSTEKEKEECSPFLFKATSKVRCY